MSTTNAPPTTTMDTEAQVFCPFCGYDMRGSFGAGNPAGAGVPGGPACPECGERFDEEAMRRAQVPWANRREIGRLRATWQTFWRVTFQSKRFGRAVSQPVDWREALRFRRRVVWAVWWTVMVTAGVLVGLEVIPLRDEYWFEELAAGWKWAGGVALAGLLWGWLYVCTGVHSYWFHPRRLPTERQNRAVALSYYACAPLLILPVAVVVIATGLGIAAMADEMRVPAGEMIVLVSLGATIVVGGILILLGLVGFWGACWSLAGRAAERGVAGQLTLMIAQPLACVLLAGLLGVMLPGALAYLYLILTTMT